MSQTRIMSIHRLLMRLFSECGGKAINGKCQTFCVWPDLWRHRWPRGQIFKLCLKDLVQASPLPVEFLRHLFWLSRYMGVLRPPPPAEGRGRTRPSRARAGKQDILEKPLGVHRGLTCFTRNNRLKHWEKKKSYSVPPCMYVQYTDVWRLPHLLTGSRTEKKAYLLLKSCSFLFGTEFFKIW